MKDLCWHYAKDKKHETVVVFVHHFGGNHKTTRRHVMMMNDFGYDCVTFSLSCNFDKFSIENYLKVSGKGLISKGGIVQRWSDEINFIVNSIEQPILFYSFSSPSLAVPYVILNHKDKVKGWICDGGPFFSLHKGFSRYYKRIHNIHNPIALKGFQIIANFVWRNFILEKKILNQLKNLKPQMPILNIRGMKDLLVFPEDIDQVFNPVKEHLNISIVELEKAGHLDGLARFPNEYKNSIQKFTQQIH